MDEATLLKQAKSGSKRAKEQLLKMHEGLIRQLAMKYVWDESSLEPNDLLQIARVAFLEAIDSFDMERGVKFTTYFGRCVSGQVMNEIHNTERMIRLPRLWMNQLACIRRFRGRFVATHGRLPTPEEISSEFGWATSHVEDLLLGQRKTYSTDYPWTSGPESEEDDIMIIDTIPDEAGEFAHYSDVRMSLGQHLEELPARLQTVIQKRYYEEHTLQEVADMLGVSRQTVSNLEHHALGMLRQKLLGKIIPDEILCR